MRRIHMALLGLCLASLACAAFGRTPRGDERDRLRGSPQYRGKTFRNQQPMYLKMGKAIGRMLRPSPGGRPKQALPVETVGAERFAKPPASGLRVTWLGHSTLLLEIDGRRLLLDPHWGPRASPFRTIGPERWYPPPLALEDVPRVDAVLVSHDHYDHLDHTTMKRLAGWDTRFVVPLGVGGHLERWGIAADRIHELDWWDELDVAGLRIACVPARHASGRRIVWRDRTLWAGYAIVGDSHRAYFSGDTGWFPALEDIGTRYGPFDLTMIEVGAYDRAWPDWHLGPEAAVLAHLMVRGDVLLPIHWGLFDLAPHAWTDPIERVLATSERVSVKTLTPRPGQSIEPENPPPVMRWWPARPWLGAKEDPIVATHDGDGDERIDLEALLRHWAPRHAPRSP
jgi:L-ascorbate metabolism protein UlaG (beta-lactamase superfamily)